MRPKPPRRRSAASEQAGEIQRRGVAVDRERGRHARMREGLPRREHAWRVALEPRRQERSELDALTAGRALVERADLGRRRRSA